MCCPLVFEFSVGIGGFVIGLGQISFFFSLLYIDDCRCCVMCANLYIWVKEVHEIVRLSIILSSNNGIILITCKFIVPHQI